MDRQPYIQFSLSEDDLSINDIILTDMLLEKGFSLNFYNAICLFTEEDDVDWEYIPYNLSNMVKLYNRLIEKNQKKQYVFVQLTRPDLKMLQTSCRLDYYAGNHIYINLINEILPRDFLYDDSLVSSRALFMDYLNILIPCISTRYKIKKIDCYVGEFPDVFLTLNEREIEQIIASLPPQTTDIFPRGPMQTR
jgi:hypothetical protein